jgi:hypothetical protein
MFLRGILTLLFGTMVSSYAPNSLYVVTSSSSSGLSPGGNGPPAITVAATLDEWQISFPRSVRTRRFPLYGSLYNNVLNEGTLFYNEQNSNITVVTHNMSPGNPIPSLLNYSCFLHSLNDNLDFSISETSFALAPVYQVLSGFQINDRSYWLTNFGLLPYPLIQDSKFAVSPLLSNPLSFPIPYWNTIQGNLYATTGYGGPRLITIGQRFPISGGQPWSPVNGFQPSAGSPPSMIVGFFQDRPNSLWYLDNYATNAQLQNYAFDSSRNSWTLLSRYGVSIGSSASGTSISLWQGFTGRLENNQPTFYLHNGTQVFRATIEPINRVELTNILSVPPGIRVRSILAPPSLASVSSTSTPTPTPTMSQSPTSSETITNTQTPSPSISASPSPSETSSMSPSPTSSSTPTPTGQSTQTSTPTSTPTWTPTSTPTWTPSASPNIISSQSNTPSSQGTPTSTQTQTQTQTLTPTSTLTPTPQGNGTDPAANTNQPGVLSPGEAFGVSFVVIAIVAVGIITLLLCFGPTWLQSTLKRTLRIDKFKKQPPQRAYSIPRASSGSAPRPGRDVVLHISDNPMTQVASSTQHMLEMKKTMEMQEERIRQLENLRSFSTKMKVQFGPIQTSVPASESTTLPGAIV